MTLDFHAPELPFLRPIRPMQPNLRGGVPIALPAAMGQHPAILPEGPAGGSHPIGMPFDVGRLACRRGTRFCGVPCRFVKVSYSQWPINGKICTK
jgi:hypothetical protein